MIEPSDTLGEALARIVRAQLVALVEHEPEARAGSDPEAVHGMRVAVRRLRAALRFFAPALPARTRAHLDAELRWLGRALGPVRDLDVQLERYAAEPMIGAEGAQLVAWLGEQRVAAHLAMRAALDSARAVRLRARLDGLASRREKLLRAAARTSVAAYGAEAVERAYRRTLKQGKRIGREPLADELHELRIRAKRLRYVVELVADIAGRDGRRLLDDLAKLQDVLGAHQDAVVGGELLRRFIEAAPAEQASTRAGAVAEELARDMARGADARARFAKSWLRFTGKRTGRHVTAVIERLRALSPA